MILQKEHYTAFTDLLEENPDWLTEDLHAFLARLVADLDGLSEQDAGEEDSHYEYEAPY